MVACVCTHSGIAFFFAVQRCAGQGSLVAAQKQSSARNKEKMLNVRVCVRGVSRVACRVCRVCRVSRVACRVPRVACRVSRVACRVRRQASKQAKAKLWGR